MTSSIHTSDSLQEICRNVKNLGYSAGQRIRLYGQQFEVLSDPFPEADGIAVNVRQVSGNQTARVLQLPATVLRGARRRSPVAA